MKLWLLRPIADDPLWEPWFNKAFGFIVRAENETAARRQAIQFETDPPGFYIEPSPEGWVSAEHSTCIELTADGEPGIIIADVHYA